MRLQLMYLNMLLPSNRKEAESEAGAEALPWTAAWSLRV